MKKRSRTTNTLINTTVGFVAKISNMLARLMLQTILIYVLGIQYAGISGLFTSILTILSLAELGIGSAIAYELYRPLQEQNEKRIAALMNFYKSAYHLVAILVLSIGLLLIPFLDVLVKDVPDIQESIVMIYVMYIVKTFFSYLLIYKSTLLVANQQNYIVSKIQAVMCLVKTIIECILLMISHQYVTYLIVEILGTIVENLWISNCATKQHPTLKKYSREKLEKDEKRKLLKGIKGLAMYKASHALGTGVDNIIISAVVNTATVGLVTNYTLISKEITQFVNQFYNAVVPSIGNFAVTETRERQHEIFSNFLFWDFWISCFCSITYFVIVQPFITLWLGEEYLLSIIIAGVISIDFYLACMLNPIASFRTANGIFVEGQYRPLIMTILNVILSLVLAHHWNVVGVFAATVLSRLLTQWYDPYLLYKLVFKKSPAVFYFKYYSYFLLTICCGIFVYVIAEWIPFTNLIGVLLIRATLCILIPNSMIILLYHKTKEYKYCINKIGNIIKSMGNKIKGKA